METFIYRKVELHEKELMQDIYRLRLQVYGHECGFLNVNDYPEGIETDQYDDQSIHFAAINQYNEVIGSLRLILPKPKPLPVQIHCPNIKIDYETLPELKFGEISRFVISKELRRRRFDGTYYEALVEDKEVQDQSGNQFLRRAKPMAFGLYRELYRESKKIGITHWYTLMETSLWLLLRIHGFSFECVGAEVDIYGPVKPYLGKIATIEQEVSKKFPQFFDYFEEDISNITRKDNSASSE